MKREWIVGRPLVLKYNDLGWVCEHLHLTAHESTFYSDSWHGDWEDALAAAWRVVRECTCNHPVPAVEPPPPDKYREVRWHRGVR